MSRLKFRLLMTFICAVPFYGIFTGARADSAGKEQAGGKK
jgi:hypothetical protein